MKSVICSLSFGLLATAAQAQTSPTAPVPEDLPDLSAYGVSEADMMKMMQDMAAEGFTPPSAVSSDDDDPLTYKPRKCEPGEDPDDTEQGCEAPQTIIFYRSFLQRLDDYLASASYSSIYGRSSVYQYTRDCAIVSGVFTIVPESIDADTANGPPRIDLRAAHTTSFYQRALYYTKHGRTVDAMLAETESGDTVAMQAFNSKLGEDQFITDVPMLKSYYSECDTVRARLGGPGEGAAPSGTKSALSFPF